MEVQDVVALLCYEASDWGGLDRRVTMWRYLHKYSGATFTWIPHSHLARCCDHAGCGHVATIACGKHGLAAYCCESHRALDESGGNLLAGLENPPPEPKPSSGKAACAPPPPSGPRSCASAVRALCVPARCT